MNPLLRAIYRRRSGAPAAPPSPPGAGGTFKVAANVGGINDYAAEPTFVDLVVASRGFGTVADPMRNDPLAKLSRPYLNAVDRFPSEDFGLVIPQVPYSASAQILHCKLGGLATLSIGTAAGYSLANQVVAGDDTTFDINIAAGAMMANATMTFTSTKRTAASATNTGCRSLVIKSPGYSLVDATVFVPKVITALRRFSSLRFMDLGAVNSDTVTVAVADRPAPGRRGVYGVVSVEDACRFCNDANTNLWWNIPAAASDALITDMASAINATLAAGKTVKFELANENWNAMFAQHNYWMDIAMASVNGYSAQYSSNKTPVSYSRTGNVVTVDFKFVHGAVAGDKIRVAGLGVPNGSGGWIDAIADGVKTVISAPTSKQLTWADAGADRALSSTAGTVQAGRFILQASRLANVLTVETGIDHGLAAAASVGINGVGGLAGMKPIKAVPSARVMTFDDIGTDGVVNMGGAASMIGTFTNPLNSDGIWDQFNLARRAYAKRTCEMSTLVKAVFGAAFGTRAFVGLMNQPGNDQLDQVGYIARVLGTPSTFLHAIGKASYIFLDATLFGGPNLRNAATYNGNTPPSHADYAAALALTADGTKGYALDKYDATAITARLYGLKMWQYEFGPDMTGNPVNPSPAIGLAKIDTLFDPLFKPSYRKMLDTMEQHGFEEVACYSAGPTKVGENNEYACWGIFRTSFDDATSPRVQAIDECMAATRTGPMRNMLNGASGATTVIDGRLFSGFYAASGAYPDIDAGRTTSGLDYVVTAPADGVYSFVPTFRCLVNDSETALRVNGALVGAAYPLVHNASPLTPAARNLTLTKGINVVRFERGALYLGNFAQLLSLAFTAP